MPRSVAHGRIFIVFFFVPEDDDEEPEYQDESESEEEDDLVSSQLVPLIVDRLLRRASWRAGRRERTW